MKEKNVRNSNYELMRIISMFLIVLFHVIGHGHVLENYQNPGAKIIAEVLKYATLVHVNSFILATGYFQCKSTFKQKHLWKIINQSLFYKILIMVTFSLLGIAIFDKLTIFLELLPINAIEYWYIQCYFILYCLSPFINKGLESIDQKTFKKLLIVLFLLFSVLPIVTGTRAFNNNGFTLYHFIYLYILGAYLRNYPLEKNYLFKRLSKRTYQLTLLVISTIALFVNYLSYKFAFSISGINSLYEEFARYFSGGSVLYNNPLVLIQSLAYFAFFGSLTIKSKFINKLASLTTGVYLIHDHSFVREKLYLWTKIDNGPIYSYKFILYIIMVAIGIYIACSLIEFLRQVIFNFIYKRKISEKIREKYYKFIHEFQLKEEA